MTAARAFGSRRTSDRPLTGQSPGDHRPNPKGERLLWIDKALLDRLASLRGPGESYSDVILRLVEAEAKGA